MTPPNPQPNELEKILNTLATEIHNLSPGDVGSMDRVFRPIDKALAALRQRERETEQLCKSAMSKALFLNKVGVPESAKIIVEYEKQLAQLKSDKDSK